MDDHPSTSSHPSPGGDPNEPPAPPPPFAQSAADWRPHPRCTSCGYELVGLRVEDNCPECGAAVWASSKPAPTSGLAIASLVLGIVSIVSCIGIGPFAIVPAVLAIVFGEVASRQHKTGIRAGATFGMSLAGRICGWVGLVVSGAFIVLMVGSLLNWW